MNPWSLLTKPMDDRPGTPRGAGRPPGTASNTDKPELKLVPQVKQKIVEPDIVRRAYDKVPVDPWGLTSRQREVLILCVQGLNRAQIARRLRISLSTTSQHLAEVRLKLHVDTTAQAVMVWHRCFHIVGAKPADFDRDNLLITNLQRATEALRATKVKERA